MPAGFEAFRVAKRVLDELEGATRGGEAESTEGIEP